uniref:Uncharacterized protein n=1 Tax=Meloidogyne enterolobii TaxID=390850 RepID=A0A6V7TY72_MELEN|nr:unnamed protein product [Meloidogyne enterolobii]
MYSKDEKIPVMLLFTQRKFHLLLARILLIFNSFFLFNSNNLKPTYYLF